jgi:hypothetical protein
VEIAPLKPATYRISVQGGIGRDWTDYFHTFDVSTLSPDDHRPITTLTGQVADQTTLVGLINALYALGLPLLSVECLSTDVLSMS